MGYWVLRLPYILSVSYEHPQWGRRPLRIYRSTFAGKGQYLDTGSKVIHNAPNTTSNINSKSISKDGGVCIYRGSVVIGEKAEGAKSNVSCESLMLDEQSQSDTIPAIVIKNDNVDLGHEAKIGRISDEAIFYLMSRG